MLLFFFAYYSILQKKLTEKSSEWNSVLYIQGWILPIKPSIGSTVYSYTFFNEINRYWSSRVLEDCKHNLFFTVCYTKNFFFTGESVSLHDMDYLLIQACSDKPMFSPFVTFKTYLLFCKIHLVCISQLCHRKNFVCLAHKLFWPFVSSYIFTQWGWRIPFGPDDFPGHIEFGESPPNYLFLSIFRAGRTFVCPLPS